LSWSLRTIRPFSWGCFLFFLGITNAYEHQQDRLVLKEVLLVAIFLSGLVLPVSWARVV
jgi:hypothetical protein